MKKLATILFFAAYLFPFATPIFAVENEADAAAQLVVYQAEPADTRVTKLRTYLESNDSPIADQAQAFISEADRNKLDWKLVAAIAGAESTFGKQIPQDSFNAWGWGIPTGSQSGIGFNNWEHGIATVSEGLAKNYYGRGAKTIYDVGWIYAANGISWGNHVSYFMDQIETFVPASPKLLPISI